MPKKRIRLRQIQKSKKKEVIETELKMVKNAIYPILT